MNPKTLVRLSNIVGTVAIILLIYWVFTFISIEVFGFKVFRENLTDTFYMSVLAILALMLGALILNVMFNLTRIAQKHNKDEAVAPGRFSKKLTWIFLSSFVILFAFLFVGDYLSSKKKERLLIASAESVVRDHSAQVTKLANYSFTKEWILETDDILELISRTDKNFPSISVIAIDTVYNAKVFLDFERYYHEPNDTLKLEKKTFIHETTAEEREYLNAVFLKENKKIRFTANDGNYELYYPFFSGKKKIVLYFSDYQRYGKIGS